MNAPSCTTSTTPQTKSRIALSRTLLTRLPREGDRLVLNNLEDLVEAESMQHVHEPTRYTAEDEWRVPVHAVRVECDELADEDRVDKCELGTVHDDAVHVPCHVLHATYEVLVIAIGHKGSEKLHNACVDPARYGKGSDDDGHRKPP